MAKPVHVADLLTEIFRRGGMKRSMRRAEAVLLWPRVAGPELSRFTRARNLQDGVLFVEVPDSETAMHLTMQRNRFLEVFRERYGVREIREIRFGAAALPAPEPTPPAPPEARVDPQELARMARQLDELELPEDLAGPAMQAARSLLSYRARRRAEGWQPCAICGALTDSGARCRTCLRYAGEARVQRAARELAVDPGAATPQLCDEERAVAATLAGEGLLESMKDLLPQVLADGTLRPQLETVARCYLALTLAKRTDEIVEDDLASLPPQVRRILGQWS